MPTYPSSLGHKPVKELSGLLGYSSNSKGAERYHRVLSRKTGAFRKSFFGQCDSHQSIAQFPINYKAQEIRDCTLKFLESNLYLFEDSEDARTHSWPTYPEHKEEIEKNLAMLIATQEFCYRRNCHAKAYSANNRGDSEMSESEDDVIMSDIHDPSFSYESTSSSLTPRRRAAQKATRINSTIFDDPFEEEAGEASEPRDEQPPNNRTTTRLINKHLNLIFPHTIETQHTNGLEWLIKPGNHWPRTLKPWAFRYLHEHNAYVHRSANGDETKKFIASLQEHTGFSRQLTREEGKRLLRRTRKYLSRNIREWNFRNKFQKRGNHCLLLEKPGGRMVKTAAFEKAWRQRRDEWNLRHGIIQPEHPQSQELSFSQGTAHPQQSSQHTGSLSKPAASVAHMQEFINQTAFNIEDEPNTSSSNPNPAPDSVTAPPQEHLWHTPNDNVINPSVHAEDWTSPDLYSAFSENDFPPTEPALGNTEASGRSSVLPSASGGGVIRPWEADTDDDEDEPPRLHIPEMPDEPDALHSRASSVLGELEQSESESLSSVASSVVEDPDQEEDLLPATGIVERQSEPYALTWSPSHTENVNTSANASANESLQPTVPNHATYYPQPPRRARLLFRVEVASGSLQGLDDDNLILGRFIKNTHQLSTMIRAVRARMDNPFAPINHLTFYQDWGAGVSLKVHKDKGDAGWMKLKATLKENFIWSEKQKFRPDGNYQVIVIGSYVPASADNQTVPFDDADQI